MAPSRNLTQVSGRYTRNHWPPPLSSSLLLSLPLPFACRRAGCRQVAGWGPPGAVQRVQRVQAAAAAGQCHQAAPLIAHGPQGHSAASSCACVQRQRAAAAGATPRTPTRARGPLPLVAAHPPAASNPLGRAAAMTGRVRAVLTPVRKGHRRGVTVCALALQ